MDNETTVEDLKKLVQKFCEDRDWDKYHQPKDLAISVITEAAELLEPFRFKSDTQVKQMMQDSKKKDEISQEVSDVLYFILRFAQMNKIDLSTELRRKLDINSKRYPIDKAKGSNKKYTEL